MKQLLMACLISAAAATAASPGEAADQMSQKSPPMAHNQCFRTHDIQSHTFADARTMYLRVGINDIYRVVMSNNCLAARDSSDALIIKERGGSGLVCAPIDFDLSVRSPGPGAIRSACIVSQIDKLSPSEAAALPKKLRP